MPGLLSLRGLGGVWSKTRWTQPAGPCAVVPCPPAVGNPALDLHVHIAILGTCLSSEDLHRKLGVSSPSWPAVLRPDNLWHPAECENSS